MKDATIRHDTVESNHRDLADDGRVRRRIILTGILQGVGCRPTVYRVAEKLGLAGWVVNTTSRVIVEIEGSESRCDQFLRELPEALPLPGRIDGLTVTDAKPLGEVSFSIRPSLDGLRSVTPIPPDTAVCSECVQELFDRSNARFLYPFITCTLCGPRFTVVRSFPYDRDRTSMADFTMCPRCREEYATPEDRRFHSQTNSCPECGPRLSLVDSGGRPLADDPVPETIRLLSEGKVVAVKGIGGFHLACDALNEEAVGLLRERKGRAEKPFAVMMPDLETIRSFCAVSPLEAELLTSPVAPIVLCASQGRRPAQGVAPFMGTLGVMLPYSPLHHLLFRHPGVSGDQRPRVLVMTSGNRSEEPIARGNEEALNRLGDLADAFLVHDREIVLRADDSVFRIIADKQTVFRRSRGLVPGEFRLPPELFSGKPQEEIEDDRFPELEYPDRVVLAAGGDLKNALVVVKGNRAVPGPHVGDLASPAAQAYFKRSAAVLTDYLEAEPRLVAVDPHPEYFSNRLGRDMGLPVNEVFHHHAHAVSLLVEHGVIGPALFAVFDGTGYGTDGTIWGGEFLLADLSDFRRVGHLGLFTLPGGEAAIREPVRIFTALAAAASGGGFPDEFIPLLGQYAGMHGLWLEAVRKGINAPLTSSMGRLFDAGAAAVGFRRKVTFEGEAAMWLEGIADASETYAYSVDLAGNDPVIVNSGSLILAAARDMVGGTRPEKVAARFHNSVARMTADVIGQLAHRTGIRCVGLTGGCFQNRLLTERTVDILRREGYNLLLHETVPPNDGGIAVGQAVAALSRQRGSGGTER